MSETFPRSWPIQLGQPTRTCRNHRGEGLRNGMEALQSFPGFRDTALGGFPVHRLPVN